MDYNSKVAVELNRLTRFHQFDWKKVAEDMKIFHERNKFSTHYDGSLIEISEKSCRELFADLNEVRVPDKVQDPDKIQVPVEGFSSTNQSAVDVLNKYSKMSLEELVKHVEESELALNRKKEEIFQRVLDSLGGPSESSILLSDPATSAFLESKREQEERNRKQQMRQIELEERELLAKERERLKNRFLEDSEDSKGLYPWYSDQKEMSNEGDDNVEDNWTVGANDISLEEALGGSEFDAFLDELEKELDSQAMGKSEEPSELEEVIRMLDEAAASSKNSKRSSSHAPLLNELNIPVPPEKLFSSEPGDTLPPAVPDVLPEQMIASKPSAARVKSEKKNPSAPVGMSKTSSRFEYAITNDDDDADSGSDVESSWQNRRQRMKQAAAIALDVLQKESSAREPVSYSSEVDSSSSDDEVVRVNKENKVAEEVIDLAAQSQEILSELEKRHPRRSKNTENKAIVDIVQSDSDKEVEERVTNDIVEIVKDEASTINIKRDDSLLDSVTATKVSETKDSLIENKQDVNSNATSSVSGSLLSTAVASNQGNAKKVKGKAAPIVSRKNLKPASSPEALPDLVVVPPKAETESDITVVVSSLQSDNSIVEEETAQSSDVIKSHDLKVLEQAPILPLLPWSSLVEKSKGLNVKSKWSIIPDSLQADLSTLALSTIRRDRKYADFQTIALIEWLICLTRKDNSSLVGLWTGSAALDECFILLFKAPTFTDLPIQKWSQVFKETTLAMTSSNLSSVSSVAAENDSFVSDLVTMYDFLSAPTDLLEELVSAHESTPSDEIGMTFLSKHNVIDPLRAASCVIPHAVVEESNGKGEGQNKILSNLIFIAEQQGLRNIGIRLVHLPQNYHQELKKYSSCHIPFNRNRDSESDYVSLWCLAFCHCKGSIAADVLRSILGPEDPVLARKTDPRSIRALYGNSREDNAVSSVPFSKENLYNELCFWFGPRMSKAAKKVGSRILNTLSVPCERAVTLGLKFVPKDKESSERLSDSSLSVFQEPLFSSVLNEILDFSLLSNWQSVSSNEFASISFMCKPQFSRKEIVSNDAITNGNRCQCFFIKSVSIASDVYLEALWERVSMAFQTVESVGNYSATVFVSYKELSSSEELENSSSSSETLNSGSRFSALQAMKKLSASDYKSHEDVGLSDTIVVFISDPVDTNHGILRYFDTIVKALPISCDPMVLGVNSSIESSEHQKTLRSTIILRGYQLLENIDHAVAEVLSARSKALQRHAANAVNTSDIKFVRGRKALETILSEFSLSNIYYAQAIAELQRYIPFSQQFITSDLTGVSAETVAHALFPPGSFQAMGAIVVPWLSSSAVVTRNLTRVVNRLEKDAFEIVAMEVIEHFLPESFERLWRDNLEEYNYYDSSSKWSVAELSPPSEPFPAIILLVSRKSALLKLKSVIGPVLCHDMAYSQYPRSLISLLASLNMGGSGSSSSSSSAAARMPLLLPTLNCQSAEEIVRRYLPAQYDVFNKMQQFEVWDLESEEYERVLREHRSVSEAFQRRVLSSSSLSIVTRDSVSSTSTAASAQSSVVDSKITDIASIIITSELIQHHGIGAIIDGIYSEGLWIVNAVTTKLTPALAKVLLDAAGASSLTMKPSKESLLSNVVLCLGLCGPMHSFVRFKSFTLSTQSPTSLWLLPSGESGVLASSSSRLSRELFCKCFDRLIGPDCPFTVALVNT